MQHLTVFLSSKSWMVAQLQWKAGTWLTAGDVKLPNSNKYIRLVKLLTCAAYLPACFISGKLGMVAQLQKKAGSWLDAGLQQAPVSG